MSLVVCVVALLFATGCAGASDQEIAVAKWSVELPGRPEPIEVTLPTHLDAYLPRRPTEYVLRTRVVLPPTMRGVPLTLVIAYMPAMASLSIDGNRELSLDASTLDSYRASGPLRWRIPQDATQDGMLDLELHVSHRFVRTAWIDSVPKLTTHPFGGARLIAVHAFNTAAETGALAASIFVSLFYAVLFVSLRDKRRSSYGWFALGALCGLPYPAFLLGLTQPVFGVYEGPFLTLALVLGSIAAMAFSRAYAGAPPPSRAWIGLFGATVVVSVVARDPFVAIRVISPIIVAATIATTVAQVAFVIRLRRGPERPALKIYVVAFAWPAAVLLGAPDILAWLGQGDPSGGIRTACLGIMIISLYQGVALSREHLVSLKRADELNAELANRVKMLQEKHGEVKLLNDELRRQIAARSRELAHTLARMGDEELAPPHALEPGSVVEGRYRVVKEIGAGGMGTVYEVERVADGQHFALKALAGGRDGEDRARFAREAQIVANVSHPNIVSIVDLDVAAGGFIFLVMDLVVGGTTLHDVRRRHHDVPWTLGVLAQVAEGLDAIHEAGIVHRDLKPGNILLSRGADGRRPLVKITDFGISSLTPEGTRISVIERAAMVASSSMANDLEVLDPFADYPSTKQAPLRRPPGEGAVKISDLRAKRTSAPPGPDSGLVTSARPGVLDGAGPRVEMPPASAAELATLEMETKREASSPPPEPAEPPGGASSERARSGRSSDAPYPRTPSAPLTRTGLIFGTPQYMAQELTSGTKNATRASDVFSLGIIAFELLTGKRPFHEAPVSAKLSGQALPTAVPFGTACPALPAAIATLLDRAMTHDPRARPSAAELAVALREAADAMSPSAREA